MKEKEFKPKSATTFMSVMYNNYTIDHMPLRDYLFTVNNFLMGPGVEAALSFDLNKNTAYTAATKTPGKFRILIGGEMIKQIAQIPNIINSREMLRPLAKNYKKAIFGVDLHELGHINHTDMTSTDIIEYPNIKLRGFLHNLCNIVEDCVTEVMTTIEMEEARPYATSPKVYFKFIIDSLFMPKAAEYVDTGATASNFLNYLLLLLRCSKENIKSTNAVYEAHKTEFVPKLREVLRTNDPTERLKATIRLGEWMVENIPEINWEMEEPERKVSGTIPKGRKTPTRPGPKLPPDFPIDYVGGGKEPPEGPEVPEGPTVEGGKEPPEGPEDPEGPKDKTPKKDPGKEGKEKGEEEEEDISEIIDTVFNTDINDGDNHEFVIAKDEYEYDPKLLDVLAQDIEKTADAAKDVSGFLKLLKARRAPKLQEGFTKGKLNVRRAMRAELRGEPDTKLFNRLASRGNDTDAAFWLLGDNSGSMSGEKSELCAKGILTMAQACDWADIPFCASCFTKTCDSYSGTCVTIIEKGFDDTFEETKPYFGINSTSTIGYLSSEKRIPTFAGNSEEINLFYIWKEFQKVKHKTKILLVLCDGATTGSRDTLKKMIQKIEDDGIIVIGIGIMCSQVASLYPRHKLFDSAEELDRDLPQFLIDTLSEYAE